MEIGLIEVAVVAATAATAATAAVTAISPPVDGEARRDDWNEPGECDGGGNCAAVDVATREDEK